MKANLYNEVESSMQPLDEHNQALADQPADKVNAPKQGLYVVDYKALAKPTIIALVIFVIWVLATWLL